MERPDYVVGQDVVVQTPKVFAGRAFIAPVEEVNYTGVTVSIRDRDIGAELLQVHETEVHPVDAVFEFARSVETLKSMRFQ